MSDRWLRGEIRLFTKNTGIAVSFEERESRVAIWPRDNFLAEVERPLTKKELVALAYAVNEGSPNVDALTKFLLSLLETNDDWERLVYEITVHKDMRAQDVNSLG